MGNRHGFARRGGSFFQIRRRRAPVTHSRARCVAHADLDADCRPKENLDWKKTASFVPEELFPKTAAPEDDAEDVFQASFLVLTQKAAAIRKQACGERRMLRLSPQMAKSTTGRLTRCQKSVPTGPHKSVTLA
jgi:hypothetical protein